MSKIIYLITTIKCSACKAQEILLKVAFEERSDVEIKIYDCSEIPTFLKDKIDFKDFPTTIFVEDDKIKYAFVGTLMSAKIRRLAKEIKF